VDSFSDPVAPDPADAFETWLLRRVAEAVEGGEVPANLLTDLQAEIAEAREREPDERQALAIQELAERFGLPVERLTELLAALEAQPHTTRDLRLRRFVEAWLAEQRAEYKLRTEGD
jgi:phytoene/squalene synthetase